MCFQKLVFFAWKASLVPKPTCKVSSPFKSHWVTVFMKTSSSFFSAEAPTPSAHFKLSNYRTYHIVCKLFAYKSFLSTSSIASKPPKIWASQRVRKRIHGGERGENIIIFVYVVYCLLFILCMFCLWKYILFCACVLRRFSHVRLFATPWKVALQAPLSMGFSRQEYWSGLPSSPPGDLLDSRVEFASLNISCIGRQIFLQ